MRLHGQEGEADRDEKKDEPGRQPGDGALQAVLLGAAQDGAAARTFGHHAHGQRRDLLE